MNYDEFVKTIGDCVQDPDKLAGVAETLTTAYKDALGATEVYKTNNEEMQQKIDQLRRDNARLYMASVHTVEVPQEVAEESRADRVARYTKIFKNED